MLVKVIKGYSMTTYLNVIDIKEDQKNEAVKITQKIMKHEIIKYIKFTDFDKLEVKII